MARALRVLDGLLLFFLACVGYRVLLHFVAYLCFLSGAAAQYLGATHTAPWLVVLAHYAAVARDSTPAMLVAAGAVVTLAGMRARGAPPAPARRRFVTTAILAVAFTAALALDLRYGITPLNDLRPVTAATRSTEPVLTLSVEDVRMLRGFPSGALAEVEGVLEYSTALHRFHLVDPDRGGVYIQAHFQRAGGSSFDESFGGAARPRYYDRVEPFIGKRVKVVGRCYSGSISADLADIALAGAAKIS